MRDTLKAEVLSEIAAGAWDRPETARQLECSLRSIDNMQKKGLPSFVIDRKRYFDPVETRAWLAQRLARKA